MTPEKQRIAIAEACGYTHVRIVKCIEGPPDHCIGHHPAQPHSIPDYLSDLNAMHEAEKLFMPPEKKSRWLDILSSVVIGRDIEWEDYHCFPEVAQATAAQRAEAFLRALNLWGESA